MNERYKLIIHKTQETIKSFSSFSDVLDFIEDNIDVKFDIVDCEKNLKLVAK